MSEDDYDMIYKVVLIGDSGVGKSNLLSMYTKNEFTQNTKTTVGVEFGTKKFVVDDSKIKAQIWDTAGQERYKSITSCYYKGAKGGIVVYDVTKKESFNNVDKWLQEFKKNADTDACYILLGNKCDLSNEREVSTEEALKIPFMETSALEKINIEKAYETIITEIHKKFISLLKDDDDNLILDKENVVDLGSNNKKNFIKKCC